MRICRASVSRSSCGEARLCKSTGHPVLCTEATRSRCKRPSTQPDTALRLQSCSKLAVQSSIAAPWRCVLFVSLTMSAPVPPHVLPGAMDESTAVSPWIAPVAPVVFASVTSQLHLCSILSFSCTLTRSGLWHPWPQDTVRGGGSAFQQSRWRIWQLDGIAGKRASCGSS